MTRRTSSITPERPDRRPNRSDHARASARSKRRPLPPRLSLQALAPAQRRRRRRPCGAHPRLSSRARVEEGAQDYNSWIALGPLTDFPEGETRLVDFRNPVTTASDGADRRYPLLGAPHLRQHSSRSSPSTARTSAARSAGSRSRALHVPLPRRRLLRRRIPRLRPARARPLRVSTIKIVGQRSDDQRRQDAHARQPQACAEPPLIQIEGSTKLAAIEQPKPRCASCQT